MYSYLFNGKEWVKISSLYGTLKGRSFCVPQGSTLELPLLNIFLSDLFMIMENVDFYALTTKL